MGKFEFSNFVLCEDRWTPLISWIVTGILESGGLFLQGGQPRLRNCLESVPWLGGFSLIDSLRRVLFSVPCISFLIWFSSFCSLWLQPNCERKVGFDWRPSLFSCRCLQTWVSLRTPPQRSGLSCLKQRDDCVSHLSAGCLLAFGLNVFWFPWDFFLKPSVIWESVNFHTFVNLLNFPVLVMSSFVPRWLENSRHGMPDSPTVLRLVSWPWMRWASKNAPWTLARVGQDSTPARCSVVSTRPAPCMQVPKPSVSSDSFLFRQRGVDICRCSQWTARVFCTSSLHGLWGLFQVRACQQLLPLHALTPSGWQDALLYVLKQTSLSRLLWSKDSPAVLAPDGTGGADSLFLPSVDFFPLPTKPVSCRQSFRVVICCLRV